MQDITNGRCGWCGTDELYMKYHDEEWGKTVTDDKTPVSYTHLDVYKRQPQQGVGTSQSDLQRKDKEIRHVGACGKRRLQ